MKRKGLIIYAIACLDVILLGLAFVNGFAADACYSSRGEKTALSAHTQDTVYGWYYKPRTDGSQPEEPPEFSFISGFDGLWLGGSDEKIIYLTFDAGYENGHTEQILDTLKKHDVPAAFFLVGHYIKTNPELVCRMEREGHLVCNHSTTHKNMAKMSDFETFKAEMSGVEKIYTDTTGKRMPKFFRPPEGSLSERCLKYAQQLGYKTVFWSFAYKDWYNDNQPTESAAYDTIISRTHPGMVALLHATSATNAKVLDSVITEWKAMGYRFESLYNFKSASPTVTQ
ncbi:MAG: polysaccharide deacetylase family protein [Christensenellales bacterium]